jgi:hypothetical protein
MHKEVINGTQGVLPMNTEDTVIHVFLGSDSPSLKASPVTCLLAMRQLGMDTYTHTFDLSDMHSAYHSYSDMQAQMKRMLVEGIAKGAYGEATRMAKDLMSVRNHQTLFPETHHNQTPTY